jgi:hypothetical protein
VDQGARLSGAVIAASAAIAATEALSGLSGGDGRMVQRSWRKAMGGLAQTTRRRLDDALAAVQPPRITLQVLTGRLPIAVEISTAFSSGKFL